jgi:hypothetical protein
MYKEVFTESLPNGYPISIFSETELKFILSKNLIEVRRDIFFPKFVGEIITPENSYFSVPKNFEPTDENIKLFKEVLKQYKVIDGRSLITNTTFTVSKSGEYKSEKYYYNELKEYFLDFITYEFIYPSKTKKVHSTSPVSGKIDVLSTIRNRKQRGPGVTYKVKDITNSDSWNLDDIYWSTIDLLNNKYEDDNNKISEMKDFLLEQGYVLKNIDLKDINKIIKDINKCDVGIIHQPIKNTLLNFYKSKLISDRFSINVFYTDKFQYVWERLIQKCLFDNKEFRKSLSDRFNRIESRRKWFKNIDDMNEWLSQNNRRIKNKNIQEVDSGLYLRYEMDISSIPDIFSVFNGKKFIGDAKYYKDPENSEFEKEFRTYNTLTDNKYPMCVFVPSNKTRVIHVREEGELELILFKISVNEVINDAINGSNNTIEKVQTLLFDKRNTNRFN